MIWKWIGIDVVAALAESGKGKERVVYLDTSSFVGR